MSTPISMGRRSPQRGLREVLPGSGRQCIAEHLRPAEMAEEGLGAAAERTHDVLGSIESVPFLVLTADQAIPA